MKDTIITVEVPIIEDATYDLTLPENKDKDITVVLTTTEPVASVIAQDGSKVTGINLQKETVVKTNLGNLKREIEELEKAIVDATQLISNAQERLDLLNEDLPKVQSKVDQALVGWKPKSIEVPVELPINK